MFTKIGVPAVPTTTLTAFPAAASPVAETLIAVPVVRLLPVTFNTFPASWLLERFARLPVEDAAPEAETLKTLPVKDCARTFTAPIVYPATESVCPE